MTKNNELIISALSLVGQVPEEVSNNICSLVEEVVYEAEKNQFYIECLHGGGVDNWEWYGDSLEDYWYKYDN